MNLQVVKTKAETALAEEFSRAEALLPGNAAIGKLRCEAIGKFAAAGLPHRRVEEWKYTDVRAFLKDAGRLAAGGFKGEVHKFVEYALWAGLKLDGQDGDWMIFGDGKFVAGNGALGGSRHSLAHNLAAPPAWVAGEIEKAAAAPTDSVLALNTALMTDGAVIDIPAGAEYSEPIHLVFHAGREKDEVIGALRTLATRNIIRVGKGAKVTFVESYAGDKGTPRTRIAATQLVIEEGAEVDHLYQAETSEGSVHLCHHMVTLGANAAYRPFVFCSGNGMTRNSMGIAFKGQHGTLDLGGLSLGTATGHADTTLVIDHAVPHCTSRELYHVVLAGEAKSVFQGKVIVRPGAQKTDGKQMARALMLSPNAEFDSKPELEIYADDVVCGHGSTSVEIDEDLLFYCRSRGIPLDEARALLVESFAGDAAGKIGHEGLRAAVMDKAREWLKSSQA